MDFQEFFNIAMDRTIPQLITFPGQNNGFVNYLAYNLGAGEKHIPGTIPLEKPGWNPDMGDQIPSLGNTVDFIWALHFLEHLQYPVELLMECQRVLKPGGFINICVPYYSSQMAHQDLDHVHTFTEDTWRVLFRNPYYDDNKFNWNLHVKFNLICGVVERNLCLLTQLQKGLD